MASVLATYSFRNNVFTSPSGLGGIGGGPVWASEFPIRTTTEQRNSSNEGRFTISPLKFESDVARKEGSIIADFGIFKITVSD